MEARTYGKNLIAQIKSGCESLALECYGNMEEGHTKPKNEI